MHLSNKGFEPTLDISPENALVVSCATDDETSTCRESFLKETS
jgi:hypothetical protein